MAEGRTSFTIEQTLRASSGQIYRAWTAEFDIWFASPGEIRMVPEVGEPYWFEVVHDGRRHPHYGRFLALKSGRLIEQTWMTGKGGTEGAETVVRVELAPTQAGTNLRLTHRGFADESSANRHAGSWPQILRHLDDTLVGSL